MATAVGAKKVNPEVDYFPLSVNYQEKYYAAGKIPGGYFKREAKLKRLKAVDDKLTELREYRQSLAKELAPADEAKDNG